MSDKQSQNKNTKERQPSREWAAGFLLAAGNFTFLSNGRELLPMFVAKLSAEKAWMLILAGKTIGLKNKVYIYRSKGKRTARAVLMVRGIGPLKSKLIPALFYTQFIHKHLPLMDWLENIERNEMIPQRYKIISRLVRSGFYKNLS